MIVEDITQARLAAESAGGKFELTLDETIGRLEEQFGIRFDPAAHALAQHKAWMEAQGREWDETPVEKDWRMQDREIPGTYMGDPNDPARKQERETW